MRADGLRLQDALEQIALIRQFAAAGKVAFLEDLLVQSAIMHRLTLLGEACAGRSASLREQHPEIPWRQIIGFRNIVVHDYFGATWNLYGTSSKSI